MGFAKSASAAELAERVKTYQGYDLKANQIDFIINKYREQDSGGTYNAYKLPFQAYAQYQQEHTSIAFGSMEHSSDFTELAMFGPGSERMKPFMINTEIHYFMLEVAEVENNF